MMRTEASRVTFGTPICYQDLAATDTGFTMLMSTPDGEITSCPVLIT